MEDEGLFQQGSLYRVLQYHIEFSGPIGVQTALVIDFRPSWKREGWMTIFSCFLYTFLLLLLKILYSDYFHVVTENVIYLQLKIILMFKQLILGLIWSSTLHKLCIHHYRVNNFFPHKKCLLCSRQYFRYQRYINKQDSKPSSLLGAYILAGEYRQ